MKTNLPVLLLVVLFEFTTATGNAGIDIGTRPVAAQSSYGDLQNAGDKTSSLEPGDRLNSIHQRCVEFRMKILKWTSQDEAQARCLDRTISLFQDMAFVSAVEEKDARELKTYLKSKYASADPATKSKISDAIKILNSKYPSSSGQAPAKIVHAIR